MAKKITKAMALTFATVVGLSLNAAEMQAEKKVTDAKPQVAKEKKDLFAEIPEVVAKIGDKEYKKDEIIKKMKEAVANNPNLKGRTPEQIDNLIKSNLFGYLNSMINNELLLALAAKSGFVPSEIEAKKLLGEAWNKATPDQRKAFEAQLKAQNLTFKEHVEKTAKLKQFQEEAAIEHWVLKEIMPSDKEIEELCKKQYETLKDKYFKIPATKEDQIVASHILIMPDKKKADKEAADLEAKKKAMDIIKEIKAGKISFKDAARKYSQGPSAKMAGSLGSFGKGAMVPEFEKAAFALAEEAITDEPVKTQYGYHIILRDKSIKADSYRPFDEVKTMIEANVKRSEVSKRIAEILEKQKAAKKVEIFVKKPAPVSMIPPELLEKLKKQAAEKQKAQGQKAQPKKVEAK